MSGVAERLVSALHGAGVQRAYTVPGESFLPLIDEIDRHRSMRLVSTRHESGASFMAEADAKLTGMPALAMATRGVGAANLAIGVHTAFQDSTPMVVILGQVETTYLGREAFQEMDLPAFYGEITKWSATAQSADRLPELLGRALHEATSGRPGPVMIAVPADLLEADVDHDGWVPVAGPAPAGLDREVADTIAALLVSARAPVVIAGGGAQGMADQLVALAEAFGLGVYAGFRRQDVFPNDHPHYLGHLSLGTPEALLRGLDEADVVLVLGSRLSEITTQQYRLPRPDQQIVQIDADPGIVGSLLPLEVGAVADPQRAVRALLERAHADAPRRDWQVGHGTYLELSTPAVPDHRDGGVHPTAVVEALGRGFDASTIVTSDAGNFSVFCHRYWRFTAPRTQLAPTSGAMGYGVPAAVAAKLAAPDREVLATVGDGGFLMTGQELETAVRLGLALTVVVFRNGLYGTIAMHQARSVGRLAGVDISDVDVAGLARAYGAWSRAVTAPDELDDAIAEARGSGRAAVLDVVVDPDVLTPAQGLGDMLRSND